MDSTVLLAVQGFSTALIFAWLAIGFWDNMRYPSVNETYTAQVVQMERMREEFPDEFSLVAHRAISDRGFQRLMFRLVVLAEGLATLLLFLGVIATLMALVGTGTVGTAKTMMLIGAAAFTGVWASFLIVGNYFCYWFGHEGAQNTHYQMTLWGLGTMIFVTL